MPAILTLADPPRPLALFELTLSNQKASPDERLIIESALRDVVRTEAEIDQVLQMAQARKQEYAEHARLLRLSLAPCRVLPQEIWSQIFCAVMDLVNTSHTPPCKIRGSVDENVPPSGLGVGEKAGIFTVCQLSLVCRMWRRAVLAAPCLWRCLPSEAVSIDDPDADFADEGELAWRTQYNYALQAHLSYAGSLALKMCAILPTRGLDLPPNVEYFKLLNKALPRLGFLDLTIQGERSLNRFSTLPQILPNLQILILSIVYEESVDQIPTPKDPRLTLFNHCPFLSEMELNIGRSQDTHFVPLTDWIQMPSWSNLTRIKARNVHAIDIFRILKVSTKLIDATFSVALGAADQSVDETEAVTCPALRILEMHLPKYHLPFFDWLRSPTLTHLVVSLPFSIRVHSALSIPPGCLLSLTHLVFTAVSAFGNTEEWVDLLTCTPTVTHLKLSNFYGIDSLVSQLANPTLLPGLKMLMIDDVRVSGPFYGTADEDALSLGLHLSALTTARFQQLSLPGSVVPNGMAGLKVVFSNDKYTTCMYDSACHLWNGWSVGSPSKCPIYGHLERILSPVLINLNKLNALKADHSDIPLLRNSLYEAIPGIIELASANCEGHHLAEVIRWQMDAVEVLEWLRDCFPNEDVCKALWKNWQELKTKYMDAPGWIPGSVETETNAFQALEYVPAGAYRARSTLTGGKLIQTYPDFKSDIWWTTDIPLDRSND